MSKIKIHELAKELGLQSKDVIDFLAKKDIEVKSHMSSIEDEAADMIRQWKKKPTENQSVDKDAPKKKNIVHLFRPQNTQNGAKTGQKKSTGGQQRQGNSQQRPANSQQRPSNSQQRLRNSSQRQVNFQQRPEGSQQRPGSHQQRPEGSQQRPGSSQQRPVNFQQKASNHQQRSEGSSQKVANHQQRFDNNRQKDGYQNRGEGGQHRSGGYQNRGEGAQHRSGGYKNRPGSSDQRPGNAAYHKDNKHTQQKPDAGIPQGTDVKKQQKRKDDFNKKKNDQHNHYDKYKDKKGKQETTPVLEKPKTREVKPVEQIKSIIIPEILTIKELADKMKIVPSVIVKKLFLQGKVVTVNQEIDYETAEEIALEFEVLCEKEVKVDVIEELLKEEDEDESKLVKRPPVVSVMGHVDHGKTSLLDAIRKTNVIAKEAGGITQHIGAYVVDVNGERITFLDTPGHEAFTAMRMRGASSTDIAVLVVAADDGVMPQTVEAINHAKAAGIEIVVAVNKIDKPGANIDKVKQELAEYELIPEDWGGSTIFVPVSAKTGEGIDNLMEMLLLTAEVLELKANPNRKARGLVIEAELDKGKGSVATVLVQKGMLHVGDNIAAGSAHGKVRAMMDDRGKRVKLAGPSMPVEILGLNDVPNAGEVFVGCDNEKEARSFAETFISQGKEKLLDDTKQKVSLDDLFDQIKEGNLKELGIVIKADVQGSVEALRQSLLKISNEEVVVKIIHGGVGAINESDVTLASASNAIIIGFNVRPDASAKETAEREGVDIRMYRVIYSAIEDIEFAMKGMLDPVFEEKILGHAEVRQTFKASGIGTIAGSYVLDGTFERGCSVRITRDGKVIFDGALASLKRFKDDVKEVKAGYECGLVFENFNDIKEEDQVEAYKMVEIPR